MNRHNIRFSSFILPMIGLLLGCSPYKNNPLNNSFHDLTAHYNAYFLANERINEIERSIFESQDWNYNKVLPIFPQFDSTKSASLSKELEDCIQKASIAIQRHPGSKWEDDSYILVGLARHYGREFPDAIETFKYVNTHSEDDNSRHYALTELIRSFTEFEEYKNAVAVTDYLTKEKLNRKNKERLYLNTAYLYQKMDDKDKMVGNLVKAEELLSSKDRARINFIIGRTYHDLGFEGAAFKYYRNVLKNHPTYDLEFYAKLYMAQVTELAEENDLKKIQRYFRSLLRDPKNKEYQDKIYYELAGFELKNNHLNTAIENYKKSISTSSGNQRQKAQSYLRLAEIYYDTLKDFELAKSYYDSTVTTMPKDEDGYAAIQERQEILAEFVKQVVIIRDNDSLLHLASLPKDSVLAMLSAKISDERDAKEKKKEREKQAALNRARNISQSNGDNLISIPSNESTWYFENANAVSRGRNEFLRKWGDRALEDNWRRRKKALNQIAEEEVSADNISEATGEQKEVTAEEEALAQMESIPYTPEEQELLLAEIEEALFNLGNIYNLRLEEDKNAIISFENLLSRFPSTSHKPEVLYQLYLLYKSFDLEKSQEKGELLKAEFPETVYAKLVDNPNFREESFAINEQLKRRYKRLYAQYTVKDYEEVIIATDSILQAHPDTDFSDNIALLKVLAIGQTEEDYKYQYELNEFIKNYPESELKEYAGKLLSASETFQQERYNSAKARFITDFNQKHLFLIVYDIDAELIEEVPNILDNYLAEKNYASLRSGNLILDESKSMALVNGLPGKATAQRFMKEFLENVNLKDQFKGKKFNIFVITEDNFDIFYKTKDVSAYLSFFEKNYP